MDISLGKNNKINQSIIGSDNVVIDRDKKNIFREMVVGIVVAVIGGIIVAVIMNFFTA